MKNTKNNKIKNNKKQKKTLLQEEFSDISEFEIKNDKNSNAQQREVVISWSFPSSCKFLTG